VARRLLHGATRAAVNALSRRSLPPRRGAFRIPGLAGEATVRFDDVGVPHVKAGGDADALAAHGFCHALDRFFQMDMLRRALRGRLAETVGERPLGAMSLPPFGDQGTTVDADRLMRSLDLVRAATRYFGTADDEGRALLDGYVRGVNAALRVLRRRRPLEHRLLGLPLVPWNAVDSVLVAKGMALGLSFKWRSAPVFGAMAEAASDPHLFAAILPPVPGRGDLSIATVERSAVVEGLRFLPWRTVPAGSNAFVVGGGLTASGSPILASDPHLELSLPSIWYLVSLSGSRYQAVGCSVPGLPGVVIGRSSGVAWGLTNGMIDDADVWTETLDEGGRRYRVDGAWRPLEVETQEIRRRGASPLLFRLRRTHRGPLYSDAFPGYEGPPLSLRLSLHEPSRDMEAFLALGRAARIEEAEGALAGFGSPCQNLLYADGSGTAGYRLIGKVPVRAPHPVHPALPRDGGTAATDWSGFVPPAEVPALRIGPDERIVSANHPQADDRYPNYLSHLYEPPYRAERIHALLEGRRGLVRADLARIQMDAHNRAVPWFRAHVLEPHADEVRRRQPSLGPLLDRLLAWDGSESATSVGAAPWHLAYHHLLKRTFGRVLGDRLLAQWMGLINLVDAPFRRAYEDPESPWAPLAVRATLLLEALEETQRDLARRGLRVDSPWGDLHALTLRHPAGQAPVVGPAFQRGPFPIGGGPFSVVSGQYLHPKPGRVLSGPSYRHTVDLAAPERESRMITFGGQSGHVGSRHYDDLTPLWLAGEGVPMRLAEAPPPGAGLLRLLPA
jgi:penicillin amidase